MFSTEEFWNSLGGKKDYQTSPLLESQAEDHPPRLYGCSNKTGRFIVSVLRNHGVEPNSRGRGRHSDTALILSSEMPTAIPSFGLLANHR